MRFKTRIDLWYLSVLILADAICLIGGIVLLIRHEGSDIPLGIGGIALSVALLLVTVPTRYTLDSNELGIRAGLFHWRIPYEAIEEIHPTRNPLLAPAWSLHRLHVRYRDGRARERFVLLSPRDRKRFVEEVLQRAPSLEREADRIVRLQPEADEGERE
ncbi:MAG: PH domain-containing protein [Deltaproteobacteria bacterium]|nr:PH domain-containing protein [Deltaproteobacteria bacterium]